SASYALSRLSSFSFPHHPLSFPTRRSSDLLEGRQRIKAAAHGLLALVALVARTRAFLVLVLVDLPVVLDHIVAAGIQRLVVEDADRKSTRLNSSHVKISYAVFCLKKKRLTE